MVRGIHSESHLHSIMIVSNITEPKLLREVETTYKY